MADQGLRVWPVTETGYGDVTEYPRRARYRVEPRAESTATHPAADLVVSDRDGNELGRHDYTGGTNVVAFENQPTPECVRRTT